MKKVRRILAISILLIVTFSGIYLACSSEDVPMGAHENEADEWAKNMMSELKFDLWQETNWAHWNFRGKRTFDWDTKRNFVQVIWDDNKVLLDTKSLSRSKSFIENKEIIGQNAQDMIQDAWSYFCNDSFWLIAPFKSFDPGTNRSIVQDEGEKALKVEFSGGGVTPVDVYVWHLDENNRPVSYKIWASILPVGGVGFTWENWIETKTGVPISSIHNAKIGELELTEVATGFTFTDINLTEDPFLELK